MRRRSIGPYQLQAAIAALHSQAHSWDETDWPQIAALYGVLAQIDESPVVLLNRAIAVGFADGPDQALELLDTVDQHQLPRPYLLNTARAEMLHRSHRYDEAADQYRLAVERVGNLTERQHLERRLDRAERGQS